MVVFGDAICIPFVRFIFCFLVSDRLQLCLLVGLELRHYQAMTSNILTTSFSSTSNTPAIIVPDQKPDRQVLTISYQRLRTEIHLFQDKLAQLGITPQSAVSIALPNSYEVSYLSSTRVVNDRLYDDSY